MELEKERKGMDLGPIWLSVKIAAFLSSMSEEWIEKEIVKKKAIPLFKDQDGRSLRFRATDFWAYMNRRFAVGPDTTKSA